jgi:branched-subunit amino acid transport protein
VRAVSNALVAALVSRLLFFPVGALASTSLGLRLTGIVVGGLAYLATRNLAVGIVGGCVVVLVAQLLA